MDDFQFLNGFIYGVKPFETGLYYGDLVPVFVVIKLNSMNRDSINARRQKDVFRKQEFRSSISASSFVYTCSRLKGLADTSLILTTL